MPRGNQNPKIEQTMAEFYRFMAGSCSLAAILAKYVNDEHREEFIHYVHEQQHEKGHAEFPAEFIRASLASLSDDMHEMAHTAARVAGLG